MMKKSEIKSHLKKYCDQYIVCVCKTDELPLHRLKRGKYIFIVKIAKTKKNSGRWVAVFIDEKRNAFYMDREGIRPQHYRLIEFMKTQCLFTIYNDWHLHYIDQSDSGKYAIIFTTHMATNKSFDEFLYNFSKKYESV